MKPVFVIFLVLLALIIGFAIFPAANDILIDFIDNVMPGLGLGTTIEAYVGAFPLILLALFVICALWALKEGRT